MIVAISRLFPRTPLPGCRYWCEARDGDHAGYAMARRHYSAWKNRRPRQRQFVGPGEPLVLVSPWDDALFVWRRCIRDDGQAGVCCTIFRNEAAAGRSSDMIREAERLAWAKWPGERLFTHVDPRRVRSSNPGYCFKAAGWRLVRAADGRPAKTKKSGLLILEKLPHANRARAGGRKDP